MTKSRLMHTYKKKYEHLVILDVSDVFGLDILIIKYESHAGGKYVLDYLEEY